MKSVFLLIFDGYADWEPALACAELNKSGRFPVRAAGFSRECVTSMAGLHIIPELLIDDIEPAHAALLIVPGGDTWERPSRPDIAGLLHRFVDAGVPIAVICGATIAAARARLLDSRLHTSNYDGLLARQAPDYKGHEYYRDIPAVADGNIITASGMGSVEFAFEILKLLDVYGSTDLDLWRRIHQDRKVPDSLINVALASGNP